MTIVEIEMSEFKKDKSHIISEYQNINKKTNEIFDTAIRNLLGKAGLKSKLIRKLAGEKVEIIVSNLELLRDMGLVNKTEINDYGDKLVVRLHLNDKFLKLAESLKKNIYSFGLYWQLKKKNIDADDMDKNKFIKNLGRTGKTYAKKSSYRIIKEKEVSE